MAVPKIDDDEFFVGLGRIAYSSAEMFGKVEELIMGMLSKSEGAAVVTTDMTYSQISHLANALADRMIKGKKELATLTEILKEASKRTEERNKVLHGYWREVGGGYFVCHRFRARGKLIYQEDDYHISDLHEIADGLDKCGRRLAKFYNRSRFLTHDMFDEEVGVRRLAKRERARRAASKKKKATRS